MNLTIEDAEKFIKNKGYGTGTNYTTRLVANLMVQFVQAPLDKIDDLNAKIEMIDPSRKNEHWIKEEDEQLKRLFEEEKSVLDMAIIHKRSRGSIYSRLKFLGLKEPRPNPLHSTFKSMFKEDES